MKCYSEKLNEYSVFLQEYGFVKKSKLQFYIPFSDFIFTVSLVKGRYDDAHGVNLGVTHPSFWQKKIHTYSAKDMVTPIGGFIGLGVGRGRVNFADREDDVSYFSNITSSFFSYFKNIGDVELALQTLTSFDLYRGATRISTERVPFGEAKFNAFRESFSGGMKTSGEFDKMVKKKIDSIATFCGFNCIDAFVYVKKREGQDDFYDCFGIDFDDLHTFLKFNFFPWSSKFNNLNAIFSEGYCDLFSFSVPSCIDSCGVMKTDDFLHLGDVEILDLVENGMSLSMGINDERDYIENVHKTPNGAGKAFAYIFSGYKY